MELDTSPILRDLRRCFPVAYCTGLGIGLVQIIIAIWPQSVPEGLRTLSNYAMDAALNVNTHGFLLLIAVACISVTWFLRDKKYGQWAESAARKHRLFSAYGVGCLAGLSSVCLAYSIYQPNPTALAIALLSPFATFVLVAPSVWLDSLRRQKPGQLRCFHRGVTVATAVGLAINFIMTGTF